MTDSSSLETFASFFWREVNNQHSLCVTIIILQNPVAKYHFEKCLSHFYLLWKCHCVYPKGRCRENIPPAPKRFILSCYALKRMICLLCSVYEWTHLEYIFVVSNSFIFFQFTSLYSNRKHGHAGGSKLSSVQPHFSWNFWREIAFCGHEKKNLLSGFSQYIFTLGAERKFLPSIHKIIFSSQVLYSRDDRTR